MTHPLNITAGAKFLAHSILNLPDQFKTISQLATALKLAEKLVEGILDVNNHEVLNQPRTVEVTEPERDLLKTAVSAASSKLPINSHTLSLIASLGLE